MNNPQPPVFLVQMRKTLLGIGIALMFFIGVILLMFPRFSETSSYIVGGLGLMIALLARFLPDRWFFKLGLLTRPFS